MLGAFFRDELMRLILFMRLVRREFIQVAKSCVASVSPKKHLNYKIIKYLNEKRYLVCGMTTAHSKYSVFRCMSLLLLFKPIKGEYIFLIQIYALFFFWSPYFNDEAP